MTGMLLDKNTARALGAIGLLGGISGHVTALAPIPAFDLDTCVWAISCIAILIFVAFFPTALQVWKHGLHSSHYVPKDAK